MAGDPTTSTGERRDGPSIDELRLLLRRLHEARARRQALAPASEEWHAAARSEELLALEVWNRAHRDSSEPDPDDR